jgi:type I restriction-modification system DNA methylase subunit
MARTSNKNKADSTANLGFEAKLWLTADKLRNNMDAAEYKHVVLGLIFLKYISDTFEEHRAKLLAGEGDYAGANAEDPDEYKAENVFWVPSDARWSHLQASAKQPTIGKTVDDAMVAIERDNPRLKGVLPKDYARPGLDKQRLGELFYSTQIPVCLWFLAKNKNADAKRGFRDRRQQTLFIDARKLGTLIDRVHRELTDADLEKITSTYHAWRGNAGSRGGAENAEKGKSSSESLRASASPREYSDVPGFCKSATTAEIAAHGHVLTPGRYVGAEEVEDDGDPFEEKMPRLVAELESQFAESAKLEAAIRANLKGLGYGI